MSLKAKYKPVRKKLQRTRSTVFYRVKDKADLTTQLSIKQGVYFRLTTIEMQFWRIILTGISVELTDSEI
jgi:hypothetical protein